MGSKFRKVGSKVLKRGEKPKKWGDKIWQTYKMGAWPTNGKKGKKNVELFRKYLIRYL